MAYVELYSKKISDDIRNNNVSLRELAYTLKNDKKYNKTIETVLTETNKGISLSKNEVTVIVGKKIEIEVYPEGLSYYSKIDGLYYKLNLNNNGITLEDAISELPQGVNSIELTAVSDSINNVKVDLNSENNSITLTGIAELTTLENFLCRQRLCLFNIR